MGRLDIRCEEGRYRLSRISSLGNSGACNEKGLELEKLKIILKGRKVGDQKEIKVVTASVST